MTNDTPNQLETLTNKYTASFEKFSNTKSGNVIVDFVLFKRNIVPYTLQIVFVLGVVATWIVAVLGVLGQGPIGEFCAATGNGKSFDLLRSIGISVGLFVFAPFVLHYVLELVKVLLTFAGHVYEKILVPIWNTLFVRFFANVAPQILPFLYERFMKAIDICMSKLDPLLDVLIDGIATVFMAVAAILKGVIWLPKLVCRRIGKWLNPSVAEVPAKAK